MVLGVSVVGCKFDKILRRMVVVCSIFEKAVFFCFCVLIFD